MLQIAVHWRSIHHVHSSWWRSSYFSLNLHHISWICKQLLSSFFVWWFKRIYTCVWLYPKVDTFFYLKGVLHSVVSSFYFFVFVLIYPRNVDIINRPVRMGDSGWASQPFGGLESPLSVTSVCCRSLKSPMAGCLADLPHLQPSRTSWRW